ncbi:DUF3164 family protein [Pseudomonas aeruginosa]|uniref:DUF3164 family protein n=1 Tax=Pseudomonas aeruginosa TaxID=287 RepID=UPI0023B331D3|nr:DUF3164 family protein [Pseudomonas aeruginosa]MDE9812408.1 DUF3164 family protein [Pseudomonas aeruginosa]
MTEQIEIPEGCMRNALGHFVPMAQVREHDKLRDGVARELASQAVAISEALAAFKKKALADIDDLIAISLERYNVKLGGKKGNVSITTYDGEFKIEKALADRLTFTDEIIAAKELIYSCTRKWSQGANDHLMRLVDRAFIGRNGQIRTNDVLGLLRLEIDDPEWKTAMVALKDALQVNGKAVYIRVYQRVGDERYEPINLSLAGV